MYMTGRGPVGEAILEGNKAGIKIYLVFLLGLVFNSFYSPLQRGTLASDPAINTMNLPLYRLCIVSAILLTVCAIYKPFRQQVRAMFSDWRLVLALAAMGACRGVEMMFWSMSLQTNSTFIVCILGNLAPLFVIVASYVVFQEKTPLKALIGVGICLVGVVVVGLGGSTSGTATLGGIVMMLSSACFSGVFFMISARVRQRFTAIPTLAVAFAFGALATLIINLINGTEFAPVSAKGAGMVVLIAVNNTLIAQGVPVFCSKYLKPTTVSVLLLLGPIFAAITAFIVLGERITWAVVLGGIIMLAGLAYYMITNERLRAQSDEAEPPAEAIR